MSTVNNPFPYFPDAGTNGYIYIGSANQNAQTNPIVAYRDAELTAPWSQPIRTVNGYAAYQGAKAGIFLSVSKFSITVKDSNGVIVLNDNAAQGFLNYIVSVKDFGAVGDGVTDDTAAIQAAINYAAAAGKSVVLPATTGSYICGPLSVTASIVGENRNTSRLKRKTGTTGVWMNVAAAGVSIRNLYLDGDYIAARGIEVDGYADVIIADNIVRKIGEYFVHFNGAQRLTICGNNYKDGANGISNLMPTDSAAAATSTDLKITGNHIENIPGTAIHIAGKQSSTDVLFAWSNPLVIRAVISNNTIFNVSGNGIIGQGYYLTIEGNTIIDAGSSSGNQAIVPQGKYISVTGNVIKGGAGVGIDMGGCTASTVTGNVVQLRAEIGIELQSCANVTCTGNSIIDCGYGITGEASAGIAVLEGFWGASLQSTANVVSGNTVRSAGSSGQYGISVGAGVQQCIVSSNMLVLSGTVASLYVSDTADALIFGNMTGSGEEDQFVLRGDNPKFVAKNNAGNADFWIVPQGAGEMRVSRSFADATTPANFVAQVCIPIKDEYGSTYYIPAKYGSKW